MANTMPPKVSAKTFMLYSEPQPYFSYPARLPADIIADAQRNLVVRDGWASFFYHTYDSISYLQQTVTGLKSLGYTFVAPTAA